MMNHNGDGRGGMLTFTGICQPYSCHMEDGVGLGEMGEIKYLYIFIFIIHINIILGNKMGWTKKLLINKDK